MRVQCDVCSAKYDIDDAKVPATGLAVKCTKCDNLFLVRPTPSMPEAVEPVTPDQLAKSEPKEEEPKATWILRRPTGKTYPFHELATLQRWIVEHKAIKTDEISSNGKSWRKLYELPELEPFFQIVEQAHFSKTSPETEPPAATIAQPVEAPASEYTETQPQFDMAAGTPKETPVEEPAAETVIEAEEEKPAVEEPVPEAPPAEEEPEKEIPEEIVEEVQEQEVESADQADESDAEETPEEEESQPEVAETEQAEAAEEAEEAEEDTVADEKEEKPQEDEEFSGLTKASDEDLESWHPPGNVSAGSTSEWEEWSEDDASKGGAAKKLIIAVVVLIVIAAAVYFIKPDLFEGGLSQETIKRLADARMTINRNTPDALAEAESTLKKLAEQNPETHEFLALLSEVYATRAEAIQLDLIEAEKRQQAFSATHAELVKAFDAASKKEQEELQKQLAESKEKVDAANQDVAKFTTAYNEAQKAAYAYAERCFNMAPESLDTNRALADAYRLGMNAAKANEHIEKALKLNPNDAVSHYIKGALFAADESLLANALQSLQESLQIDGSLVRARFRMALLYLAEDKPEEARKILEDILAAETGHTPAKNLLGRIAPVEEKKPEVAEEKAEEKKEEPKKEEPKKEVQHAELSYEQLLAQAKRLQRSDRAKAALGFYKRAENKKATSDVYSGMGYCYFDLGQNSAALSSFKKALQSNARHQGALFGVGMVSEEMGNKTEALTYYQRYLDFHPGGPDALPAKNAISRLGGQ